MMVLCKSGRISYIWDLIDEMHNRGQPANIINYNSLIDGLCKNSHLDKAISLFNKIEDRELEFKQICAHSIYFLMHYAKVEDLEMYERFFKKVTLTRVYVAYSRACSRVNWDKLSFKNTSQRL